MNVNEQSSAVSGMATHWRVTEALMGGTAAMRAEPSLLPRWPSESQDAYQRRLSIATLLPVFERTVSIMSGKPFSKQMVLGADVPPKIVELCENINLEGQNLHTFSYSVFEEALAFGFCGILVDFPVTSTLNPRTVADEKSLGIRPHFNHIRHNQFLGARVKREGAKLTIMQLRISEEVEENEGSFGTNRIQQIRVLSPGTWELYRLNAHNEWSLYDQGITTLPFVPFVPFYGSRKGFLVGRSALENLAYQNVKHWQSQSDQDTLLHVARVPILVVIGADDPDPDGNSGTSLTIGASSVVRLPIGSEMKYVEHTGSAITAGQVSLERLEEQMIQTGAELLVVKPGQRTATESNNEGEANKCDLQRITECFEDSMDQALQYMALWLKEPQGGHVSLFKDFGATNLTDASAQLILQLQQTGAITRTTLLREQQRRGVLSPELDPVTELEQVEEEGARLSALYGIPAADGASDVKVS